MEGSHMNIEDILPCDVFRNYPEEKAVTKAKPS